MKTKIEQEKKDMKITGKTILVFAMVIMCLWSMQSEAAQITSLFNTGVNGSGSVLDSGVVDPHYIITYSTDLNYPGPSSYVSDEVWPVGDPWVPNSTKSKWISPSANPDQGFDYRFIYRTTFDLTKFNLATASITGYGGTDDEGYIYLNGNYVGNITGFESLTSFTISNGFIAGLNTLEFDVINSGGGPTGLRVEMTGNAASVPVPPTLLLLAPGLAGLIGFKKKYLG
jgi:hypothetical protein